MHHMHLYESPNAVAGHRMWHISPNNSYSFLSTLVCIICFYMIHQLPSQVKGCCILFLFMRIDASIYCCRHDGLNHIAKKGVNQVWRASRCHLSYPMILPSHGFSYTYDYPLHHSIIEKGHCQGSPAVPRTRRHRPIKGHERWSLELKDELWPQMILNRGCEAHRRKSTLGGCTSPIGVSERGSGP